MARVAIFEDDSTHIGLLETAIELNPTLAITGIARNNQEADFVLRGGDYDVAIIDGNAPMENQRAENSRECRFGKYILNEVRTEQERRRQAGDKLAKITVVWYSCYSAADAGVADLVDYDSRKDPFAAAEAIKDL